MSTPLPRNEHGDLITSAEFGETWVVEIQWSTDFDNREIDPLTEEYPRSLYGPFFTEAEAKEWLEAYPEFTEIHEMLIIPLNSVRPAGAAS